MKSFKDHIKTSANRVAEVGRTIEQLRRQCKGVMIYEHTISKIDDLQRAEYYVKTWNTGWNRINVRVYDIDWLAKRFNDTLSDYKDYPDLRPGVPTEQEYIEGYEKKLKALLSKPVIIVDMIGTAFIHIDKYSVDW